MERSDNWIILYKHSAVWYEIRGGKWKIRQRIRSLLFFNILSFAWTSFRTWSVLFVFLTGKVILVNKQHVCWVLDFGRDSKAPSPSPSPACLVTFIRTAIPPLPLPCAHSCGSQDTCFSHALSYLILAEPLWGRNCYHLLDKEDGNSQRGLVVCPKPHSQASGDWLQSLPHPNLSLVNPGSWWSEK